jgi:phage-related protein
MLHACRKQKNKTEKRDSDIIIKRAKELGEKLSKKII